MAGLSYLMAASLLVPSWIDNSVARGEICEYSVGMFTPVLLLFATDSRTWERVSDDYVPSTRAFLVASSQQSKKELDGEVSIVRRTVQGVLFYRYAHMNENISQAASCV